MRQERMARFQGQLMPADQDLAAAPKTVPIRRPLLRRLLPVAVVLALVVVVLVSDWRSALSLETLVRHRMAIDAFLAEHRLAGLAIFMAIYIGVVALSVPGAVWLTLAGGILFGAFLGAAATIVSATIGASIIFKIAQSAVGEAPRISGPMPSTISCSCGWSRRFRFSW